jgi:DNA/RNA endonuclease G (NUC1)
MKKTPRQIVYYIIGIIALLCCISAFAQKYDTLIVTDIYKSYYSKEYKNPVILTYTLYHGGGESKRDGMNFTNDIKSLNTATNHDYNHEGYDKGHMANAQDFAYDSKSQELTFRYYNCVPQAPGLNRGAWKSYETQIRKVSQEDSLFIICYNTFGDKKMNTVGIPEKCYKFVYDITTKKWIYAFSFTNQSIPTFTNLKDSLVNYNFIYNLK